MRKVEILAPAGSYAALKAAINAGADAIYLGGTMFGARAYANNFTTEELIDAIGYAHTYGVKIYLTVNTLLKDGEIESLYDYLLPLYKAGLDAVIVQDLGVLQFVKMKFPELEIHASTQMSTTGKYGAALLKEMGVTRVVTAREISLNEIRQISENVDIEIESFVHGAMCYCYSGQCFLSSFIGGRSGNRGRCAQACRLPYEIDGKQGYYMSLKDMCTLSILPEIIEAGVYSLKIEGRMKSPEYTALVVSTYRKYVDLYQKVGKSGYNVEKQDMLNVMDIFNRGNFSEGYYIKHNGKDMMADKRPNHQGVLVGMVSRRSGNEVNVKLIEDVNEKDVLDVKDTYEYTLGMSASAGENILLRVSKECRLKEGNKIYRVRNNRLIDSIREAYIDKDRNITIKGVFEGYVCKKPKLSVTFGDVTVEVIGEQEISIASNRPVSREDIEKQLRKTGNTRYVFGTLDIKIDDNIFIPLKSLNELRRAGLELLMNKVCMTYQRPEPIDPHMMVLHSSYENIETPYISIQLPEQTLVDKVIDNPKIRRIYIESTGIDVETFSEISKMVKVAGKELYIALPYIFRKNSISKFENEVSKMSCDGFLVRTLEEYAMLRELGITENCKVVFDYNVYEFNRYGKLILQELFGGMTTSAIELNSAELASVGCQNSELIVYGYIPMMISAQCFMKNTKECRRVPGLIKGVDRCKNTFFVKNNCEDCYNLIYNAEPIALYDKIEEIEALKPDGLRIVITDIDKNEIESIVENVLKRSNLPNKLTRGHFMRGIQ